MARSRSALTWLIWISFRSATRDILANRRLFSDSKSSKGQSTSPVQWDGFPLVGATLVVALPVQATEIDRGLPRDSQAMSRRSTGSELVRAEAGAHKGRPYGIRMPGWTPSTHPGGDALLLGHILSVCSQECLVRRAQPRFRFRIQRIRSGLILLLVPSLRGTPVLPAL